ncbi:MAG TPA: XRE family transcriptional regulator [Actinomycetes bacterium]|jgi:lambda repressor-like predicted transcriptional regulator|nr:XRE family transcriptional regulator [Actinomycetes bacterium]
MAANEPLRKAMADARITIEALGHAVSVHPKTVQRWLAGRVPHPRHRWAIADLLGVREEALWPGARAGAAGVTSGTSEILAAYSHRADVPSHVWHDLLDQAKNQIDLLAYAMLFLPEANPHLVDQLKEKGAAGCAVRIALADPDSAAVADRDKEEGLGGALPSRIRYTLHYLGDLSGQDGISLHLHAAPMYNSVFRFDDEMLVTPHLYAQPGYASPVLHLRRIGPHAIFDNFAFHFERVWLDSA